MANANIFAQFARPVRSIAEYQDDAQQREAGALNLEGARRKNAMDAMTMEQGMQKRNAIQSILAGLPAGADKKQRITAFRNNPYTLGEADALEKADQEERKTDAEINAKDLEAATKRVGIIKTLAGHVAADPTPENAMLSIEIMERETGQKLPQERQRAAMLKTPEQVIQWARAHSIDADKLLPKMVQQTRGGTVATMSENPLTGQVSDVQSAQVTQTEAQRLQLAQQASEGALNRGVQVRGQDMVDARSKDATAQASKAPAGYRYKPDGSMEAIPGGPADLKNTAGTVAKVTDAQDVLSLLDQAEPLLDKSTGSYVGAAIDEAGRAVGGATGGAKAAAQLRTLEGALISKMPKMSGPQSDKDVLLYKQMAGQIGDRTIPAEQKRAAMQTIREINERHAGGGKPQRTVVRTGKSGGRKVVEYSDGTISYAD